MRKEDKVKKDKIESDERRKKFLLSQQSIMINSTYGIYGKPLSYNKITTIKNFFLSIKGLYE